MREKIIGYTKKDFMLRWYSGSGSGGQHRNKHQNCCEITHIESGMKECGTANKSRVANQRDAFNKLAMRVVTWFLANQEQPKEINENIIRNYNECRNEVHDKESGVKLPYKSVVVAGDLSDMVESRSVAMGIKNKLK